MPKLNNKGLTHWEKNVSKHGDFFDELGFEGSLILLMVSTAQSLALKKGWVDTWDKSAKYSEPCAQVQ